MVDSIAEGEEQPYLPSTLHEVMGAQERDPLSWQKLDARLRPWLHTALTRQNLPPGTELEDVVSEVFLTVYRDISEFEIKVGASFRGWLLTIADRNIKDFWRKYRAQKRGSGKDVQLTDTREILISDHREQRQSVIARSKEAHEFLQKALRRLSPKHRMVTELRMLENLDYSEIAVRMGYAKPDTVKVLFHHARKKLQQLMAPFRDTEA